MQTRIFKPSIRSIYSKFMYYGSYLFMSMFILAIIWDPSNFGDMFMPFLFVIIYGVIAYYQINQKVFLSSENLVWKSPFEEPKVINFQFVSEITCEQHFPIFQGFRYYALAATKNSGEKFYIPMYIWDKDELNDILDIIFQNYPNLHPDHNTKLKNK